MSLWEERAELREQYPKEVILKDGTGVTIRPARGEDEEDVFEMFQRFSEEDRWFLDDDISDRDVINAWIKDPNPEKVIPIVAQLENRIIALGLLKQKYHGSKSHIGKIVISVDPIFRENRLGTWILLELINLAMERGVEILLMSLVRDRDALVIRGIKSLDFVEEARFRDYVRAKDGQTHDLVIMTKRLFPHWGDF